MYRTRSTTDFGSRTYTLGGGRVLVRQQGRQLEVLPFSAPLRELKELTSDSIDTSSSDEGEADDVLQGLLAQLGMESDSEPPFEKDCMIVARMAGLPRIMDDLDNEWLEAVHIGSTLSPRW